MNNSLAMHQPTLLQSLGGLLKLLAILVIFTAGLNFVTNIQYVDINTIYAQKHGLNQVQLPSQTISYNTPILISTDVIKKSHAGKGFQHAILILPALYQSINHPNITIYDSNNVGLDYDLSFVIGLLLLGYFIQWFMKR